MTQQNNNATLLSSKQMSEHTRLLQSGRGKACTFMQEVRQNSWQYIAVRKQSWSYCHHISLPSNSFGQMIGEIHQKKQPDGYKTTVPNQLCVGISYKICFWHGHPYHALISINYQGKFTLCILVVQACSRVHEGKNYLSLIKDCCLTLASQKEI